MYEHIQSCLPEYGWMVWITGERERERVSERETGISICYATNSIENGTKNLQTFGEDHRLNTRCFERCKRV